VKSSFRLGVLLVGLVAINVYVFFFNRKTAPREVLNLQSTAKTMETTRRDLLADDAKAAARTLLAAADTKPNAPQASAPRALPGKQAPAPAHSAAAASKSAPTVVSAAAPKTAPTAVNPAAPKTAQTAVAASTSPVRIPFAPPAEQGTSSSAAPAAHPAAAPRPLVQVPFAPPPEDDSDVREPVEKKLAAADTLGQVLAREGFGSAGPEVVAALSKLVDPRSIRGGQKYAVRLGDDGTPESFEYQPSPVLRYVVERQGDDDSGASAKWKARKLEAAVELKTVESGGVVESSLYESVQKAGESSALVSLLVELFAWDVNFYIDTHPGDHWKVIIEKQYLGGQFYKYGRLLGAEYGGKVGTYRAFFWAGKDAARDRPGKYYDEHGQALSKSMLKTPLRFVRISSKFDRKRFHPILHVEKAHLGIDYAAPVGTPVWASASGRVVEVGMKRGSGNTIVIAHSNGLSTRYYHLSRYARGLHVGQQVKQKDVIGFVGTTGLSTGPHLHFSVTKNGAFVDPSKLAVNRDPPVPDPGAYMAAIRPRITALKAIQPGAVARN
jgi:murein DD-endopeptidase MepM/ murein hydrolase activator NlpD